MSRKWTPAQQDAICARGGPLLVSAAAGSGKTAVLVERVVGLILNKDAPVDADRLLIVTFTRAAAAEMKDRIEQRLSLELQKSPDSTFLQRQKILLSHAHIGTVDSFCKELVQENFSQLGMPADFRVADSSEMNVLRAQTLENVLDDFYAAGSDSFYELIDTVSTGRDDSQLSVIVQTLYDFVRSHPFPHRWLREKAEMYRADDPDKTPWGTIARQYAAETLSYCIHITQHSIALLQSDSKLQEKCVPILMQDLYTLQNAAQKIQNADWNEVCDLTQNLAFEKMAAVRGYRDNPCKQAADANRKEVKQAAGQLQTLFSCSKDACREDFARLLPMIETLFSIVETFAAQLDAAKMEKKLADFGDLEHQALRLLVEETADGWQRTPAAKLIGERYDEILVDEYQDTNELQDLLFRAVSQDESNLFMVGDVKQSIYGFRQAQAGLFLARREASTVYDKNASQFPACITLGRNFRSRAGVTEAVNFIFRQLMSQGAGGLNYTDRDALICGAEYPPSGSPDTELDILERRTAGNDLDPIAVECRRIAEYISDFLQNGVVQEDGKQRPGRLGDICILLRSANPYAPLYARTLNDLGIPAWADPGGGFFGTPEVRTALSFLRTVNNPLQDIPLLAVLTSPVYGFTPDELAEIRIPSRQIPLYLAVEKAAKAGSQRCTSFLEDLQVCRAQAAALPADRFVDFILRRSGYQDLVLAMDNGDTRLANLHLLLEYARKYEHSSAGGLSGFIRFIDRMQQEGSDLGAASSVTEGADVVRIMSIHRSKGLEFPVVILAGCCRRFHRETGSVCLHPKLGFGVRLRDKTTGCRYTTLPREAALLAQEKDEMSEELRVLYVAMTRAKEKLLMLCSVSGVEKHLASLAAKLGKEERFPAFLVRKASNAADWLMLCALRHPDAGRLRQIAGAEGISVLPSKEPCSFQLFHYSDAVKKTSSENEQKNCAPTLDDELYQVLKKETAFVYPYRQLGEVRAKTAASEVAAAPFERGYAAMSRPAFLGKGGMTPAERGTALHNYMQYINYQKAAEDPYAELSRLYEQAYLTKEQADSINLEKISAFFASSLAKRILQSPKVLREYRFTVEVPASRVEASLSQEMGKEPVIIQGAIDCAFLEEDSFVLLDYKTDKVQDSEELRKRYQVQLQIYKKALEACTGKAVKECLLYAFSSGQVIPVYAAYK
ncbi:MAG: helicase-exonuclease AddAB subunit AddA [Oscillospiraceae bacterium]|jgi:ATP-dependent helicase/nuclease subunit A|nr:helicase-exonuclease AddAB subunit AddA [Oscillospiraceae bacterium]